MSKIAKHIAQGIVVASGQLIGKTAAEEMAITIPIIEDELKPVMEVLRDALREGFSYGRGIVECVECKSRARKERLVIHTGVCWVGRAQGILKD
jgi:hypothetical protein